LAVNVWPMDLLPDVFLLCCWGLGLRCCLEEWFWASGGSGLWRLSA
jgi:hypothetical protein